MEQITKVKCTLGTHVTLKMQTNSKVEETIRWTLAWHTRQNKLEILWIYLTCPFGRSHWCIKLGAVHTQKPGQLSVVEWRHMNETWHFSSYKVGAADSGERNETVVSRLWFNVIKWHVVVKDTPPSLPQYSRVERKELNFSSFSHLQGISKLVVLSWGLSFSFLYFFFFFF